MRKLWAGAAIGMAAAIVALVISHQPLFVVGEAKLYDWRMQRAVRTGQPRQDIALVEINEASLRELEPLLGRWPWPRVTHANLIDFIASGGPKVIAYDVLFTEPDTRLSFQYGEHVLSGDQSDGELGRAIQSAGNVIMLADAVFEGITGVAASEGRPIPATGYPETLPATPREIITPPLDAYTAAARAIGHNYLVIDDDGVTRRVLPFIRKGDRVVPSFGVAAAVEAAGLDKSTLALAGPMQVRYEAPPLVDNRRAYPSYEARHLLVAAEELAAGQKPSIDPSVFKDRIVFVGATAEGVADVFSSPFREQGRLPGILLHASVADNVLSGRAIRRVPRWVNTLVLFVPVLLVGVAAARLPLFRGTALSLAIMTLVTGLSFEAFARGHWSFLAGPWLGMALALFGGVAFQYFFEDREKRRVKQLFGRYVSPDVFERLLENPALARLGGERRNMTVLFSDIRGFTSVSERGNPEEVVAQLNEYFGRMVEVVFRHGGTVDKFVGDMVMALFGAPVVDARHADHAVAAAVDMTRELDALNAKWAGEGQAPLDIGIGVNSGEMIAGNIGSERIMSYTVIGDAVNLGSRLESLNKDYGTRIIISDSTRTQLTRTFDLKPLGQVTVKGRSAAVDIYEVRAAVPVESEIT